MKFHENKFLTTVAAAALALAVGACSSNGDSDDSAQTAAEAELAALQAAHGEDDLTPEAITALSEQITTLTAQVMTLMGRADITPADLQGLNDQIASLTDQITALMATTPTDVQDLNNQITALNTQVTNLMARADITPAALLALNDQITALMATTPTDIQDLNDQITALNTQVTNLMGRADITPADLLGLRDEITALNGQITDLNNQITALMATAPEDIQDLNDQITDLNTQVTNLMGRADITPADLLVLRDDVTALNGQVTTLMARADITPAAVQGLRNQIATLTTQVTTLMGTTPANVRALQEVVDAFATVRNSQTDAEGAASAAAAAVVTAMESLMKITARDEGVAGDSATAAANAQAVLDAQIAANEAVDDADAAVQGAKDALVVAKALPSDDPNRDTLIAALEDALKAAEGYAKAAADSRGAEDGAIAKAVEGVTGADPEAEGYPMTPAQHGRAVAMDIAMALVPTDGTNGARKRGDHVDVAANAPTAATAEAFPGAVMMNDHQGSTWAEIVGVENVRDMRIGVTGGGTKRVSAASFDGMAVAFITTNNPPPPEVDAEIADGAQYDAANYKGIPGTVFCAGTDCMVEEVAGINTLTGSWYFAPGEPEDWYVKSTDDEGVTTYSLEMMYAKFGHWLTGDANDGSGNTEVNTFALTPGNTEGIAFNVNTEADATTLTDTSASYRGPAVGMSVEKTTNSDGEITEINSGAFTATVNLKATFGESPTLGGTVTDFQGPATDANWSVELQVRSSPTAPPPLTMAGRSPQVVTACGRQQPMARMAVARRVSSAGSTPTSRTVMPPGRTPRDSSRCITWDRDLAVRS